MHTEQIYALYIRFDYRLSASSTKNAGQKLQKHKKYKPKPILTTLNLFLSELSSKFYTYLHSLYTEAEILPKKSQSSARLVGESLNSKSFGRNGRTIPAFFTHASKQ